MHTRETRADDIAVLVTVTAVHAKGLVVTYNQHVGRIWWPDAVGALKGRRMRDGQVREGDTDLVGLQLMAAVSKTHEASGRLEFVCRRGPGRHPGTDATRQLVAPTSAPAGLSRDGSDTSAVASAAKREFLAARRRRLFGENEFPEADEFAEADAQGQAVALSPPPAVGSEVTVTVRRIVSRGLLVTLGRQRGFIRWRFTGGAFEGKAGVGGGDSGNGGGGGGGGGGDGLVGRELLVVSTGNQEPGGMTEFKCKPRPSLGIKMGQLVTGVVVRVDPCGAFVDYGDNVVAFLHVTQISRTRLKSASDHLREGEEVKAVVLHINRAEGRIALSSRWLERTPGGMLTKPRQLFDTAAEAANAKQQESSKAARVVDSNKPGMVVQVGQMVTGVVRAVTDEGAVIDYGGAVPGYMPSAQLSRAPVACLEDHLAVGDELQFMVVFKALHTGKVSLSTKWLEREEGAMLRHPRVLYGSAEEAEAAKAVVKAARRNVAQEYALKKRDALAQQLST